MLRYITASAVKAQVPTTSETLDSEFWEKFERKLKGCRYAHEKYVQTVSNLHDTANRICDVRIPVQVSTTTWWDQENVLCFNPSNVHPNLISAEQRASLLVMHEPPTHARIYIIIDVSNMTLWNALDITSKASYNNIVDGLRLWSTNPYSVEQIHIVRSKDSKLNWVYGFIVPQLLSKKLQERVHVSESLQKTLSYINEHKASCHDTSDVVCDMDNVQRS
jgi:hypothetical protein